jgi:DNA-binding transcriptional LysR family regulator
LEKVAAEPLIGLRRKDYREYYLGLDRIFGPLGIKPRIAVECDSASSLITEVETGRGVALASPVFKHVSGKRLLYRSLAGINESVWVGIARAKNGDLTPAGEKFCEMLRKASKVPNSRTTKAVEQNTYRERG